MRFLIAICCLAATFAAQGQAQIRKLPTSINHPAINVSSPYVSFDGNVMVFLSDNAEDYVLTPFFTYRERKGDWKTPAPFPSTLFNTICYKYDYTLGPLGKKLYFSTAKGPTVGGYDIWTSTRTGSSWGNPTNLGAPINSRSNEASATYTPDGKQIYFMRCERMDQKSASGCKIWMANMNSNGTWATPVELPESINKGNSQSPRIMADGETLIFSSDKHGGMGGMDLLVSKLVNGSWSTPRLLEFVNSEKNDQYVSANALGRYLLKTGQGSRKTEIVEHLMPSDIRPKGIQRIQGRIDNPDNAAVYISVFDKETSKRVYSGRPDKNNSFEVFLKEGTEYQLSIDAAENNYTFYIEDFDLTGEEFEPFVQIAPKIKRIAKGDELDLESVSFISGTSRLDESSYPYLDKIARMMKGSTNRLEIQVMLVGYLEDSVRSNPDLTETVIDSVTVMLEDIDSLGQLFHRDSSYVKFSYHNNRTEAQAGAIMAYLEKAGVTPGSMIPFFNARPVGVTEEKRLIKKAVIR